MKRALKILVPLVVLTEVILVWSGVMDLGDAVLVVAGLEALIFLVGFGGLVLVVRRYRKERKAGLEPWRALEDGLSLVLPRTVARLILHEPRLFASLFRWTFRRVRYSDHEFAYHKRTLLRAIVPVVIVTSPLELLVVHLLAQALSPWSWLKWALLALGVYAVLWLLGLYASLVALPQRLEGEGLRLRHGVLAEGFVPYEEIETVVREESRPPIPETASRMFSAKTPSTWLREARPTSRYACVPRGQCSGFSKKPSRLPASISRSRSPTGSSANCAGASAPRFLGPGSNPGPLRTKRR